MEKKENQLHCEGCEHLSKSDDHSTLKRKMSYQKIQITKECLMPFLLL